MGREKAKSCVIMGCDREAAGSCVNCCMPVCERHSRRSLRSMMCLNCFEYMKRLKARGSA